MKTFGGYTTRSMKQSLIDRRYVLGDLLGSGGMAKVFLAHDELLNRDVALKVLRDQYAENEEFVERFRREARSAATLNHPDIVSVYDWGCSEDGTYYMVMEFVSGGTLKDCIASEGPLDTVTAAELGSQVAEALAFAHERGVIHRDVKSQNILLTASGDAKVADFGIARAAAATAISRTGLILGTISYMSPEQAMGEPAGPASDLYSLGVVLYEMLTGELPFEAEALVALCMKHVNEPPCPPREVNPEVSEGMNTLVLRLLDKKAENRYESAAELAEDLRRVRNGLAPLAAVKIDPEATRIGAQATVALPPGATARKAATRKRARTKAPWILAASFMGFVLLSGASWGLSQDLRWLGLAFNAQDLQTQDPAPGPQDETPEVPEEASQAASVETPPTKQSEAPNNTVSTGTIAEQDPPAGTAAEPFRPASTPASTQVSSKTQPTSTQQAQVRVVSSQSSYSKSGGTQAEHHAEQVKNPGSSHKS